LTALSPGFRVLEYPSECQNEVKVIPSVNTFRILYLQQNLKVKKKKISFCILLPFFELENQNGKSFARKNSIFYPEIGA